MRVIVALSLLFAGGFVAVIGAGGGPEVKVPALQPLATPDEALRVGLFALAAGDETRALATIRTTSDDQRALLHAIIANNQTVLHFRELFIAKYGKEGWATFQGLSNEPAKDKVESKDAPKNIGIPIDAIDEKMIKDKVAKAIIEVRDKEAFARFPRESKPTRLVKVDGGWAMGFDNFGNVHGELANQIKTLTVNKMTQLMERYSKAIGAKKSDGKLITPQDIAFELGRAVVVEQTGVEIETHRFEIDKLK
jgi:hypothetical protein